MAAAYYLLPTRTPGSVAFPAPFSRCFANLCWRTTPPYGECGLNAELIVLLDRSNSRCNYAICCQFGQGYFFLFFKNAWATARWAS